MITTADAQLAARLRRLRQHGMSLSDLDRHRNVAAGYQREQYLEIGWNARMTDIQAAVGLVQLGRLPGIVTRRRELASAYGRAFSDHAIIATPLEPADRQSNYQSYVVQLRGHTGAQRDRIVNRLLEEQIATRPGLMAAHLQPPYAKTVTAALPMTDRFGDESLMLPLYHELGADGVERVARALDLACREAG